MNKNKITYQGIPGSFSYTVALKFFGKNNIFLGVKNFEEIFIKLKNKTADFGVLPIENSIAGSVYENYNFLSKYKTKIIGEAYLKIEHNLLGIKIPKIKKSKRIKMITKVFSHYKALEQCSNFFKKYYWMQKEIVDDTATAAQFVANNKNPTYGAIASKLASKIYNLNIILKNIEDHKENYTRFLIITNNQKIYPRNPNKCSIILSIKHQPGSLYKVLKIFAENNINLTKIESYPIVGKIFEYFFYIDFELNKQQFKNVKKILQKVKQSTLKTIILGFYKKGKYFS